MSPIIYLIRHGEKPSKLPNGEDANGLSAKGVERAQGLRQVFGKDSVYNIQYILAEHPKKDGSRDRPYETILPLSQDLGLDVNKSIDRDDVKAAAEAAKAYTGPGNVLVCWEHGELAKIVEKLGVKEKVVYPSDRFDIIWMVRKPYEVLEWVGSEGVPGLDDGAAPVGPVGPVIGGSED
ncbi:putative phosphoglycerate mutase family protein [Halenospora varia]|nr:putative phosphoglycerate mutase family protein [Halenospora varia]KAH6664256.1 putative phosphoglycerate mutase family protein [Halenospora varia]